MRVVGTMFAVSLLLASCGQSTGAPSAARGTDVDRADVVAVAEAMVTALLVLDLETFRSFVVLEERSKVDDLIAAAKLGNALPAEEVTVTAVLIERSETRATVDYDGTYCVASRTTEVSETTAGAPSDGDGAPGRSATTAVIEEPRRCFSLDDTFATDAVQFRQIDGEWFGPLPS